MNVNVWAGQVAAPLAVAVGLLSCFWGYRILKVILGIVGLLAGAAGGWAIGLSLAPGNNAIALACAVVVGLIGAALCIWLFFLGVFLVGASAGAIVGVALFTAAGNPLQPLLLLAVAIFFGVLALVMQKFMVIVSTAFSGSYLIIAGILHLVAGGQNPLPLWFDHLQSGSAGIPAYAALVFWLVLGLAGVRVQYRGSRKKAKTDHPEAKSA